MTRSTVALVIVGLSMSNVGGGVPAAAQSLGEIAMQEAERRSTIVVPAKVITEEDLVPVLPLKPSTVAPTTAGVSASPLVAMPESPINKPPEGKYVARDASHWLSRMRDLRARQDRLTLHATALKSRADALTSDFNSTWDRRRRASIESERQGILTERALVGADLTAMNRQIFDLEEEARRSNVPPGWLRP